MSRTKTKDRTRYPCGKLKPSKVETASPGIIREMIATARRQADNPLLRSEIGRLRLTDVLTDVQALAATRFAMLLGDYEQAKGYPRRSIASPSYEAGFGKGPGSDSEDDQILSGLEANGGDVRALSEHSSRLKHLLKVERRYVLAINALRAAGRDAENAVLAVAVHDEVVVTEKRVHLAKGLQALAVAFDLVTAPRLTNRK
jgi:hypothetical protein